MQDMFKNTERAVDNGYRVFTVPYFQGHGSDLYVLVSWALEGDEGFGLHMIFNVAGEFPIPVLTYGPATAEHLISPSFDRAKKAKEKCGGNPELRWTKEGSDLLRAWLIHRPTSMKTESSEVMSGAA